MRSRRSLLRLLPLVPFAPALVQRHQSQVDRAASQLQSVVVTKAQALPPIPYVGPTVVVRTDRVLPPIQELIEQHHLLNSLARSGKIQEVNYLMEKVYSSFQWMKP